MIQNTAVLGRRNIAILWNLQALFRKNGLVHFVGFVLENFAHGLTLSGLGLAVVRILFGSLLVSCHSRKTSKVKDFEQYTFISLLIVVLVLVVDSPDEALLLRPPWNKAGSVVLGVVVVSVVLLLLRLPNQNPRDPEASRFGCLVSSIMLLLLLLLLLVKFCSSVVFEEEEESTKRLS